MSCQLAVSTCVMSFCLCLIVCVCVCVCVCVPVKCEVCSREFSRESDKKRSECLVKRRKPVSEQSGAVQYCRCEKWFKSNGGLSVHSCRPNPD